MKTNMRILITICALVTIAFSACVKKVDDIFPETPDERLAKVLTAYKEALMSAPGWKLFVYPKGLESQDIEVGGLTFYVTFPDSNRTVMVGSFNNVTADEPKESSWHLKATQRPSLVFDTYSYIHIAADPDETVSFSPTQQGGYGWGSDYDFSFRDAEPGDTLFLEGNFNQSEALMVRASAEEIDAAFNKQLKHIVEVTGNLPKTTSFLYFNASDNSKIGVTFNNFLFRINFVFLNSGVVQTVSVPFSHTTYGVHFKAPLTIGGYTFQDLYWDDVVDRYYINSGSVRIDINNSATPLIPMRQVLGTYVVTISVPHDSTLPGQSATFATAYEDVKFNLKNSGFNLDLRDIDFVFDDASKTMGMLVNVEQDGVPFVAAYLYDYSALNSSNVTNFTRSLTNGNGSLVETEMAPLLDYMDNDNFKVDYYTAATPALGQFTSRERTDFFFTGNIQ
jgi:hypothetical protein